jgi:uncharacterized protein (TIGR00251 family)
MLRETAEGVAIAVRAQPGAKKTALIGVYGEGASAQLKIAVSAPPIEGRANDALVAFLADYFSVPRGRIALLSGQSSRNKVFLVRSISLAQIQATLQGLAK